MAKFKPRYSAARFDADTGTLRQSREVNSYAEALGVCRGSGGLIRDRMGRVGNVVLRVVGPRGGTITAIRRTGPAPA